MALSRRCSIGTVELSVTVSERRGVSDYAPQSSADRTADTVQCSGLGVNQVFCLLTHVIMGRMKLP